MWHCRLIGLHAAVAAVGATLEDAQAHAFNKAYTLAHINIHTHTYIYMWQRFILRARSLFAFSWLAKLIDSGKRHTKLCSAAAAAVHFKFK